MSRGPSGFVSLLNILCSLLSLFREAR
jgi:hypothetical protein